jgi:hypothetical protein
MDGSMKAKNERAKKTRERGMGNARWVEVDEMGEDGQ